MENFRKITFSFSLLFLSVQILAQEIKVNEVLFEFESGNYSKAINMIEAVEYAPKNSMLTAEEKLLLKKVKIAAYSNIDSTQKSLDLTKLYLKNQPYYQCNTLADIEEFCEFRNAFNVNNKLELAFTLGISVPIHFVTEEHSVIESGDYSQSFKPLSGPGDENGIDFNLALRYRFLPRINISADIGTLAYSYGREIPFHDGNLSFGEATKSFYCGVSVSYSVFKNERVYNNFTLRNYFDLGVGYRLNFRYATESSFELFQNSPNPNFDISTTRILSDYDLSPMRNTFLHGVMLEQRWTTYFNRFGVSIGIQEIFNVNQSNISENRYVDSYLLVDYYYIDSDFYVMQIIPKIGLHFTINHHITQ